MHYYQFQGLSNSYSNPGLSFVTSGPPQLFQNSSKNCLMQNHNRQTFCGPDGFNPSLTHMHNSNSEQSLSPAAAIG